MARRCHESRDFPTLNACAISFADDSTVSVAVLGLPEDLSLRVTFDGRLVPSTTSTSWTNGRKRGGERLTTLTISLPSGDDFEAVPVGLAWVVATHRKTRESSFDADGRVVKDTNEGLGGSHDCMAPMAPRIPLLFVPDEDVAREMNAAVATIRESLSCERARTLVLRVGNCITDATVNRSDLNTVLEVTRAMGMQSTAKMLLDTYRKAHQRLMDEGDESEASAERGKGGWGRNSFHEHASSSDSDEDCGVMGPSSELTFGGKIAGFLTEFPAGKKRRKFESYADRVLRENPGLAERWMQLSRVWGGSAWLLITAPSIFHLLHTRHECGVDDRSALVFALTNFVAATWSKLSVMCLHVTKTWKGSPTAAMAMNALVWLGYGILAAGSNYQALNAPAGRCSTQKCIISICVNLTVTATVNSLNLLLHKRLFLTSLINAACVVVPVILVGDDRWIMMRPSTFLDASERTDGQDDLAAWLVVVDMVASMAFIFAVFLMVPWLVAREMQRQYISHLLLTERGERNWSKDDAVPARVKSPTERGARLRR